jgi:hypothetical protein
MQKAEIIESRSNQTSPGRPVRLIVLPVFASIWTVDDCLGAGIVDALLQGTPTILVAEVDPLD